LSYEFSLPRNAIKPDEAKAIKMPKVKAAKEVRENFTESRMDARVS
jgi:hypothetical protein